MDIASLLDEETVFTDLNVSDKQQLLDQLIDSLRAKVEEDKLDRIREAVLQREKIMSTGVGKGLAIPHGKAKGLDKSYAAFTLLEQSIEYDAIDDKPVTMVFLLVGPESENSLHIKLLSRISRLMNNEDFRDRLQQCSESAQIIETFEEEEQRYFGMEKSE